MIINLENGTYVDIYSGVDSTTVEIFSEEGICLATCSATIEDSEIPPYCDEE